VDKLRIGPRRVVVSRRGTAPTRVDDEDEDEDEEVVVVITAVVVDRIAIIVLWRSFFDVRSFGRVVLLLCWKLKKKKRRRRHFFTSSFRQVGHSVRRESEREWSE
jgi:hypothetical protein